jgi:hypothetical protein
MTYWNTCKEWIAYLRKKGLIETRLYDAIYEQLVSEPDSYYETVGIRTANELAMKYQTEFATWRTFRKLSGEATK